jgi:fatty-acyl-CoA synthase
MWDADRRHGVTHLCGAPIVMSTLLNALRRREARFRQTVSSSPPPRPPPESVLAAMADAGFNVTHLYGLTEVYGPAVVNDWKARVGCLPKGRQRAAKKARQGVRYVALEDLTVIDPETMEKVPADGETMGEVMFRGNVVMKGYLKNPASHRRSVCRRLVPFRRSRRDAPDGYIQLKDRSKDIIISGGENISSIEVEDACFTSTPRGRRRRGGPSRRQVGRDALRLCRTEGRPAPREDDHRLLPRAHGPLQGPRTVVFTELPKTSTGKIQKFAARAGEGCQPVPGSPYSGAN